MDQNELLKIIEQAAKEKTTILSLLHRRIKTLPPEIGKLTNLTRLLLHENQLTSIPAELGKLTRLTRLLLNKNQLTSIPAELGQLINLTELRLHDNQLTSVPAELGQLTNLTRLELHNNQLTSIPAKLGKLTTLRTLDLSRNVLKSIPVELGQLTNLTQLHLSRNQLKSVPSKLGQLKNLRELHLDDNPLTSIPAKLSQLTSLTWLRLENNQLTNIPAELGKLTNLTKLYLYGNQLTSIPAELGNLTSLTELQLHANQLTSIPAELGKLTKLDNLYLDHNEALTSPPSEVVKQGTKAILTYLQGQLTQNESKVEKKDDVKDVETKDSETVLEAVSIAGSSVCDQPSRIDTLGFKPYTTAIARFLSNKDTEPPLTMSLEGEWGSGKSSFMMQLEEKLKRKGGLIVRFSPWRHDDQESVWAAFALEFGRQLSNSLPWWKSLRSWWRLLWKRFNWREGWVEVTKVGMTWLVYILLLLGVIIIVWGQGLPYLQNVVLRVFASVAAVAGVFAGALKKIGNCVGSPLRFNLRKYVEAPDYTARVCFVEHFHKDFKNMIEAYAGEKKVYVFIDDLDRCEVPKAADLMRAINLMISDNPRVVFIMGMDREKVAAGLAVKDERIIPYLNQGLVGEGENSQRLAGLMYGYSFIEKFIQLPFSVPRPTDRDIKNMMDDIAAQKQRDREKDDADMTDEQDGIARQDDNGTNALPGHSAKKPATETGTNQRKPEDQEARNKEVCRLELSLADDSPQVRQVVQMVSPALDFNPRRIKQFINLFRLRAYIAYETQLLILLEDVGRADGVTLEQLGKIVTISLRWPLLLEALARDESLLRILSDFAEPKERDINTLKNEVAKHWVQDVQLLELIRFGCVRGEAEPREWTKNTLSRAKIDKLLQVSPKVRNIKLAPLEISVSSAVAVAEAVGAEVVITEQHTTGEETDDAKRPEDNRDRRPKKKKKATKKTSKRASKKEAMKKTPKKKEAPTEAMTKKTSSKAVGRKAKKKEAD